MVKIATFPRLIRVGLPNKLRGEIWEACCGSIYLRAMNPGEYKKLLKDNEGKKSLSLEEIEKDLNRLVLMTGHCDYSFYLTRFLSPCSFIHPL
jgi:hypothetical protein